MSPTRSTQAPKQSTINVNLSTLVIVVAIATTGFGWGVYMMTLRSAIESNTGSIERNLSSIADLNRDVNTLRSMSSDLSALQTRVGIIAADSKQATQVMNDLVSDVRVVKEVILRIDKQLDNSDAKLQRYGMTPRKSEGTAR